MVENQPVGSPLPAAHVRQSQDCSVAGSERFGDPLVALLAESVHDLGGRHGREAKAMKVVVGVGGEDLVDAASQLGTGRPVGSDPAKIPFHDPSTVAVQAADQAADGSSYGGSRAGRGDAGQCRGQAVAGDYARCHQPAARSTGISGASCAVAPRDGDDPGDAPGGAGGGRPTAASASPGPRWPVARP